MKVPQRVVALREQRIDPFLRTFEWTWTTAVLAGLAMMFFTLITMVIVPSFWMYFAEQKLGWGGPSGGGGPGWYWLELRDAIAMGLTTGPFVTVLVASALLQNYRRRLRGRGGDTRPTGGYR
jgi:hypothetical protein